MNRKIKNNLRLEARRTIFLIIPALFIILFLSSFIVAETDGSVLTGKQSECVQLPQECADCTYVKLTTVTLPDLSQISIQTDMTQNGTSFNYTFCSTESTGSYSYCTKGDVGGTDTIACKDFRITPSGSYDINSGQGFSLISSLIIMIVIAGMFLFIGFSSKNIATKVSFISFSCIILIMAILFTVISAQQNLYGFTGIVSATETFFTVIKYLVGVGILSLFIIIILIIKKAWKIKRGYIDK